MLSARVTPLRGHHCQCAIIIISSIEVPIGSQIGQMQFTDLIYQIWNWIDLIGPCFLHGFLMGTPRAPNVTGLVGRCRMPNAEDWPTRM